ncbi:cation transporter [bacterium]|nr:cation transporter [bacterium]
MTTHTHDHGPASYSRAFAAGIILNVSFVLAEVIFGIRANSMALIADAGHNFSDVLSLALAWGASLLAARPATEKRTYGFRKATVMASLVSAVLLLVALGGIIREAVVKLARPAPVGGVTVIIVAAAGVVVNTVTAVMFLSGRKHDLNIRGAFLHMAADAAVSLGVVAAGAVITATGWLIVDPLISIGIAIVILAGTWSLLRDSFNLALDSVPAGIDLGEIRRFLLDRERVVRIHDLHVWALSTTETALSVHLVLSETPPRAGFLAALQRELHERFGIGHSTIQVEHTDDDPCALDSDCG